MNNEAKINLECNIRRFFEMDQIVVVTIDKPVYRRALILGGVLTVYFYGCDILLLLQFFIVREALGDFSLFKCLFNVRTLKAAF
jgi:hypothetical protein